MFEKEEFSDWFKENTPKEGLSENTTFTKQFVIDAWNDGYNKAKEEIRKELRKELLELRANSFDAGMFLRVDETLRNLGIKED